MERNVQVLDSSFTFPLSALSSLSLSEAEAEDHLTSRSTSASTSISSPANDQRERGSGPEAWKLSNFLKLRDVVIFLLSQRLSKSARQLCHEVKGRFLWGSLLYYVWACYEDICCSKLSEHHSVGQSPVLDAGMTSRQPRVRCQDRGQLALSAERETFDPVARKPLVCPTLENYRLVCTISAVKYKESRGSNLCPLDHSTFASLRNYVICLLKLGFLAQAHFVCVTIKERLAENEPRLFPLYLSLMCYETICHYEAKQTEQAESIWRDVPERGKLLTYPMQEDFEALVRYRSRVDEILRGDELHHEIHHVTLWTATEYLPNTVIVDQNDDLLKLQESMIAKYMAIDLGHQSNDIKEWESVARTIGFPAQRCHSPGDAGSRPYMEYRRTDKLGLGFTKSPRMPCLPSQHLFDLQLDPAAFGAGRDPKRIDTPCGTAVSTGKASVRDKPDTNALTWRYRFPFLAKRMRKPRHASHGRSAHPVPRASTGGREPRPEVVNRRAEESN